MDSPPGADSNSGSESETEVKFLSHIFKQRTRNSQNLLASTEDKGSGSLSKYGISMKRDSDAIDGSSVVASAASSRTLTPESKRMKRTPNSVIRALTDEKLHDFITEVKKRPELWCVTDVRFRNKRLQNLAWDDLAKLMDYSVPFVKALWKHFKDYYRDIQRSVVTNEDSTSKHSDAIFKAQKWRFYENLRFLEPFVANKQTTATSTAVAQTPSSISCVPSTNPGPSSETTTVQTSYPRKQMAIRSRPPSNAVSAASTVQTETIKTAVNDPVPRSNFNFPLKRQVPTPSPGPGKVVLLKPLSLEKRQALAEVECKAPVVERPVTPTPAPLPLPPSCCKSEVRPEPVPVQVGNLELVGVRKNILGILENLLPQIPDSRLPHFQAAMANLAFRFIGQPPGPLK